MFSTRSVHLQWGMRVQVHHVDSTIHDAGCLSALQRCCSLACLHQAPLFRSSKPFRPATLAACALAVALCALAFFAFWPGRGWLSRRRRQPGAGRHPPDTPEKDDFSKAADESERGGATPGSKDRGGGGATTPSAPVRPATPSIDSLVQAAGPMAGNLPFSYVSDVTLGNRASGPNSNNGYPGSATPDSFLISSAATMPSSINTARWVCC